MEFRLLGPVEVIDDDRSLELGGPKQRVVLVLLLLRAGRVVARDRLVDELWRGAPPPGAETTLRSYLSRLRSVLGGGRLRRQQPGYLLAIEPDELDAGRFERLAARGRKALARGRAGEAADLLREALELWRGPVACDVADELRLQPELARLEELRLVAIEDRVEADLQLGRQLELVSELQGLVSEHPLRERLWGQLMLALYHCERQAEALEAYTNARSVLTEELGLEPAPPLHALQQAILRHELPAAGSPREPAHNLPAELTTFIGRQQELADVAELLRRRRFVTLTGLGGIGKTRLALRAGREALASFHDGVWLVELAGLSDPALIPQTVAEAIGVREIGAGPQLDPVRHLRSAELLLLVDNCEHLREPVAQLVEELLKGCEGVHVLATSREPTGAAGEAVYQLQPLALPSNDAQPDTLADCAPVRLFLDRASLTGGIGDADLPMVARICRELDGLPLAIELAAAHTPTLSPTEIAERLDNRFRLLRYWRRVTPARHQTLLAAMDWSYELLTDQQRGFLRRLAVFAGDFTLHSVAAICLDGDEERALDLVEELVRASLVVVGERNGDTRYRLLETVRQYAAARLEQANEREEISLRHAQFILRLAESANLSAEAEEKQRFELVIPEQNNARAAIEWALVAGEVDLATRLAVALENFWVTRNPVEGMRWFERLLEPDHDLSDLLRARALRAYAGSSHTAGELDRAEPLYEQSLAEFRALDEQRATALLLHRLGMLAVERGETIRARPILEESLELARGIGSRRAEAQTLGSLGSLERAEGKSDHAAALFERSAVMSAEIGRVWWQSTMLANLAELALEAGHIDEAAAHAQTTLALVQHTGDRQTTVRALAYLASTAAASGDACRAGRLWAAVEAEEAHGAVGGVWANERQRYARLILEHDGPELELGLQEGSTLSLIQAVKLARETLPA